MMYKIELAAMTTEPLPKIYWVQAFVSTVTVLGSSTSTKSFVPGTVPLSQMVGSPQLPLAMAVIHVARPIEGINRPDIRASMVVKRRIFMGRFIGCRPVLKKKRVIISELKNDAASIVKNLSGEYDLRIVRESFSASRMKR